MHIQKRVHSGFIAFLFLLAAVLLLFSHTRGARQELGVMQKNIEAAEQKLVQAKQVDEGTEVSAVSEIDRKELDRAIPANLEQDIIITDISQRAREADISFNALTFSLQESSTLGTVNISAGFQGSSGNIIRFLKMLESNQRKLVVKDAGISQSETSAGLQLTNLNVTLQAFYRK